ncbi:Sphingosine kinase 1 [Trichoplax sp. H2]|nr:Sphingosine kinase 1 [Trichoplax sp. H2]|eukprot:RDD37501.1 Sphingosine kinase 1 [Trichoplax sp. H2]
MEDHVHSVDVPILHDVFKLKISKKTIDCVVDLYPTHIEYRQVDTPDDQSVLMEGSVQFTDAIGCHTGRRKKKSSKDDVFAYLTIYSYPLKDSGKKRRRTSTCFRINKNDNVRHNQDTANLWRVAILCRLRGIDFSHELGTNQYPPEYRYVIFVNPKSGTGKSRKIFKNVPKRMLREAEAEYTLITTERQGHAYDYVKEMKLNQVDGIIIVSGDGLIHEVINGLMSREDWEHAIKLPIGALPGGSGNALYQSILYESKEPTSITSAMFMIIKRYTTKLDLVSITTLKDQRYSFLSVGWGLLSDVDIGTEKFRKLGTARFVLGTVKHLTKLKYYHGKFQYLPNPMKEDDTGNTSSNNANQTNDTATAGATNNTESKAGPKSILPPINESLPSTWETVEDDMVLFGAIYLPYLSTENFVAPTSRLNDGIIHLQTIDSTCNRKTMLKILSKQKEAGHLGMSCVEVFPCKAFRLEPITSPGIITVDGECVDYGTIQGEIFPGLSRVFCRRAKSSSSSS